MKSAQRWDLVGTRKPTSHRYNPMLYEINELIDPNFAIQVSKYWWTPIPDSKQFEISKHKIIKFTAVACFGKVDRAEW